MSEDYSKWSTDDLFRHAFLLMERADRILDTITIRCEEHQRKESTQVSPIGKPLC